MEEQIIKQLNWRYATKAYDSTKRISDEYWAVLEQSLIAAPSSFGLQPYKFIVVRDPEKRARIRAAAWNQAQTTDASHLVVFAYRKSISEADIDRFIEYAAEVRGHDTSVLAEYAGMIKGSVASKSPEEIAVWNSRQAYIALGFLLETAALLGIDATPMEGFEPAAVDGILGLTDYASVVLCPLGYRDEVKDWLAALPKVRFPKSEIFEEV